MGLALVTRIPTLVEAQIAAGALRSAGIQAEVADSNFGQTAAPVIEGLGGYRIMAPEAQAGDARQVLKLLRAGPGLGEPDDVAPWTAALAESASRRRRGFGRLILIAVAAAILLWLARAVGG